MFERFLRRPALAIVISLLILFTGGLAINTLPISQFPSVAPPTVNVSVSYPGASAKILIDSTMVILEQAINGVPNMRYMMGDATSAGEGTITIVFEPGTDPRVAVMQVNNRVQAVKNNVPELVQREGIIVQQNMTSMLMYVNVYSKDPDVDQNFLYNYATVNILREIQRIPGVGRASILGNRAYSMRVELDPERMRAYRVSSQEVMEALDDQSMIGAPGRLGQATGVTSQTREYVLTWIGRYKHPEQYEDIILRANAEGEILRLKDIATVRLGSSFYDLYSDFDGYPSAAIVLKQVPGSNAADVIRRVKQTLDEIKAERFPPGMDYEVTYDVSGFLDASIEKVVHTLFEAFLLVSLVVFLFLGDFRSTLIPLLAVPVSLIGSFFAIQAFGLSINLITLFALVLAIGIVVDNAIVVVEAVHEKMHSKHLGPYPATVEVVQEISGAIIAITLVMTAVFIPVTFVPGPVGVFYREFGITMAASIVLSGVVALTLTPVLCAMILKPPDRDKLKPGGGLLGLANRYLDRLQPGRAAKARLALSVLSGVAVGAIFFLALHVELLHAMVNDQIELTELRTFVLAALVAVVAIFSFRASFSQGQGEAKKRSPIGAVVHGFDRGVDRTISFYAAILRRITSRRLLTVVLIAGSIVGIAVVNEILPSGFIPQEDQGMIYGIIQTPPGSTLEYTNAKCHELQAIGKEVEEITSVTSVAGYEVLTEGRGSNAGTVLINLKPWNQRERSSREIIEELEEKGRQIANVKLEFFEPPAVPGFGMAAGFSLNLLDKTNSGDYEALGEQTEKFMAALRSEKELKGLFTFFAANYPQYEIVIDNQAAMQKGASIRNAMENLGILVGSTWEQGFVRFVSSTRSASRPSPSFVGSRGTSRNLFVKNEAGQRWCPTRRS
ncbi:MAG: efflux RND transporter permease subunit [Polyangiaceae bacterium]